ncbi:hypothetical protein [Mesohalobacter halotolerans]|uniref:Uncharacterized protein n=1 Tax=Mesohalobacter halotolerans TaxID=1883405 RepID=A0A4U5TTL7_9FLAO|nr:hypothetical protein [Mesohalobacter halotolerans]TKS57412.1 hypothetical protein FCN74_03040 [Mesohalobacter halotolerans]
MKKRICIYPKDVAIITGKTERYGRSLLKRIRERLNKEKHQVVSVSEFCDYIGLDEEEVRRVMM